jgi:MoaA/NifB/PqqE/SkfB family radical SAM enzyme
MIGILGNPEYLDKDTALKLKRAGVTRYQLSIDGLQETHDSFRSKGSFNQTLKGIEVLNQVGIPSVVMFTLSKQNADELIPVINLVAEKQVKIFDFARLVPTGKGMQLRNQILEPREYRPSLKGQPAW